MRRRREDQRGATLVEFALVLPLFVLLLFAIIDFGWMFTQFLDVKQGAREGARLAIVNSCDTSSPYNCQQALIHEVCARIQASDSKTKVGITEDTANNDDVASVTVERQAESLSGMLSAFIDGNTLRSTVEMKIEQPPAWSPTSSPQPCGP